MLSAGHHLASALANALVSIQEFCFVLVWFGSGLHRPHGVPAQPPACWHCGRAVHVAPLPLCSTIPLRVYRKALQAVHRGTAPTPSRPTGMCAWPDAGADGTFVPARLSPMWFLRPRNCGISHTPCTSMTPPLEVP